MKRLGSAGLGTVAALAMLAACATSSPVVDDAETLMALERTWANAVMTHGAAPLEGFLADDFTQTSETGEVRGREETIARVGSSAAVFSSGGLEDMRVRLYGDAAVVTGRFAGEGRAGDEGFTVNVRWTDTFVRRDGRWSCVASQSTTIADGS